MYIFASPGILAALPPESRAMRNPVFSAKPRAARDALTLVSIALGYFVERLRRKNLKP
jgi:hypothetical protein